MLDFTFSCLSICSSVSPALLLLMSLTKDCAKILQCADVNSFKHSFSNSNIKYIWAQSAKLRCYPNEYWQKKMNLHLYSRTACEPTPWNREFGQYLRLKILEECWVRYMKSFKWKSRKIGWWSTLLQITKKGKQNTLEGIYQMLNFKREKGGYWIIKGRMFSLHQTLKNEPTSRWAKFEN